MSISELQEGVIQIRRKALRAGGLGFVVDLDHSGRQAIKVSHFQVESKPSNKINDTLRLAFIMETMNEAVS